MKKRKTRILPIFLCLLLTFAGIGETGTLAFASQPPAADAVSANDIKNGDDADSALQTDSQTDSQTDLPLTPDTLTETAADTANTVTVRFLNTDGTDLLPCVTLEKGALLSSVIKDAGAITPVRKGYELARWSYINTTAEYKERTPDNLLHIFKPTTDYAVTAIWKTTPYEYAIQYQLAGGKFTDADLESQEETTDGAMIFRVPQSFTVESNTLTLCDPVRKDYFFDGWFTESTFQTKITAIPSGTYMDSDENGMVPAYNLYAKWSSAKPGSTSISSAQNTATGKIKVVYAPSERAQGYELTYATDKSFKKNTNTMTSTGTSITLSNLPKGKTYYLKLRAYTTDSTGEICYSAYSSTVTCKITKGVKEYTAKKNSGKLKNVRVKDMVNLSVTATVSRRLKSSDESYYLVKVDPITGKITKAVAKTAKTKRVSFELPLKDDDGNNLIQGKYGVAVKKGKSYMLITSTSFISNPEDAAGYTDAFPSPASKKGRQGLYNSSMGDKNYFFNFDLNSIIGSKNNYSVKYKYNGKTYYFQDPGMQSMISSVNNDGGTVTMQVMLTWSSSNKKLILKSGRKGGAHYYAFNTEEKAAREQIEAAFCYLAEAYGKEDCHVDNWIVGNEVNTFQNPTEHWYYAGNISRDAFIKNYASTFRILYYAVRSQYKNGRVYICSDHTWINREQDWGSKNFMTAFHREIKSQNKNIQWNLAYHCYSAVLTNADFWNDGSLATGSSNTDFVSPNNLSVMTNYVKENFGKNTRIILSEQGFSSSGGTGSPYNNGRQTGESVQAAAVAYLFYKAQFNDMIDAVIYNAIDNGTAPGFHFGLDGKKAENVYRYMDTPKYASYTKSCLSTIGKSSWKNAVSNFSDKKLKAMPNR